MSNVELKQEISRAVERIHSNHVLNRILRTVLSFERKETPAAGTARESCSMKPVNKTTTPSL